MNTAIYSIVHFLSPDLRGPMAPCTTPLKRLTVHPHSIIYYSIYTIAKIIFTTPYLVFRFHLHFIYIIIPKALEICIKSNINLKKIERYIAENYVPGREIDFFYVHFKNSILRACFVFVRK